ncbi:hypothetical protein As57867_007028, partial [Aphanomyces stellatus]
MGLMTTEHIHTRETKQTDAAMRRRAPRWLYQCVSLFAKLKHTICAVYFAIQVVIFVKFGPTDIRNLRVFDPIVMAGSFAALALLHVLFLSLGPRTTPWMTWHPLRWASRITSFDSVRPRLWLGYISDDTALAAFNVFEVVCQSYQLVSLMAVVVDAWFVTSFATVVVLHCFVTPWLFYNQTTSRDHTLLVGWTSSLFSFCLSCLFPFVGICLPALEYLLVNPAIGNDPLWISRIILMSRAIVASSPLDFATKIVMDVATLVSLRRLTHVLATYSSATIAPTTSRRQLSTSSSSITCRSPTHSVAKASIPAANRRPLAIALLVVLVTWGAALTILLLRTSFFRTACPPTCVAHATPLLDLTCRCKYVHVNCH